MRPAANLAPSNTSTNINMTTAEAAEFRRRNRVTIMLGDNVTVCRGRFSFKGTVTEVNLKGYITVENPYRIALCKASELSLTEVETPLATKQQNAWLRKQGMVI